MYGGETWSKKYARDSVLSDAMAIYGPVQPLLERSSDGVAMVLSGPDAADVRALSAADFPVDRIVAVDTDADCIAAAKPLGCITFHGDVLDAAVAYRNRVELLVLDLCSQLNEESVRLFARVVDIACRNGAWLIAAFSYGRESADRMQRIHAVGDASFKAVVSAGGVVAARKLRAKKTKYARYCNFLGMVDEQMFRRRLYYRPASDCSTEHDRPSWLLGGAWPSAYFYNGASTPMMYTSGALWRSDSRGEYGGVWTGAADTDAFMEVDGVFVPKPSRLRDVFCNCAMSESRAKSLIRDECIRAREDGCNQHVLADAYNINAGQIAAWRAVNTRRRLQAVA